MTSRSRSDRQKSRQRSTSTPPRWRMNKTILRCVLFLSERLSIELLRLKNFVKILKPLVNPFFRILTLISVGYLLFDRLYETNAIVSSSGSDPKDPLSFPFVLSNSSHIFPLKDIKWTCHLISLTVGGNRMSNLNIEISGKTDEILAGGVLNLPCYKAVKVPKAQEITDLKFNIDAEYEADIFGIYFPRKTSPVPFTWVSWASNPQWVKGEFAK